MYNQWFLDFAPATFRETRAKTTQRVEEVFRWTEALRVLDADLLKRHPGALQTLRMCTAPPLARDRLIGLAGVTPGLVRRMELQAELPPRMNEAALQEELSRVIETLKRLIDDDLLPWLNASKVKPTGAVLHRAATIVADRLCGAVADPIIRNAQEQRQLATIRAWLEARGYQHLSAGTLQALDELRPGQFVLHFNLPINQRGGRRVNVPMDVVIRPRNQPRTAPVLLLETKSAGDFANTNKRRKEEATKHSQLRETYGNKVRVLLFLCGYFDSGYLGYEAAEGIDWVWEHRIDDLEKLRL